MDKLFRTTFLSLLVCIIAVSICYFWVDQPVIYFVARHHIDHFILLKWFTTLPNITIIVPALLIILAIKKLKSSPLSYHQNSLFMLSIAVAFTFYLKETLKYFFGRTWPTTWIHNNPSLLHDQVFGFFPFHNGVAYAAFPSGHTPFICCLATILWLTYPKFRWLSVLSSAVVIIGLIGMNYHFISDIVAGAWLGIMVSMYSYHYCRTEYFK